MPASVVAYDHATGFACCGLSPAPPSPCGWQSGPRGALDRLMVVTAAEAACRWPPSCRSALRRLLGVPHRRAIFHAAAATDHSGAALINREGELVGIGSLFVMDAMTPGERLPGNMFVPVDLLKPILEEMIATGRQKGGRRPWIGLNTIEDDGRLKVLRVSAGGPADRAGVQAGDIMLSAAAQIRVPVRTSTACCGRWASRRGGGAHVLQGTE